jgi:hypothetical protein
MVFTTTEAMAFIFYCDLWLYYDRDCRDYYRFPLSSLSFKQNIFFRKMCQEMGVAFRKMFPRFFGADK